MTMTGQRRHEERRERVSLIRRKPVPAGAGDDLITLREGAAILALDESTIRKRLAGTDCLTLVRYPISKGGKGERQTIRLIRSEVVAFKQAVIDAARVPAERAKKLADGAV